MVYFKTETFRLGVVVHTFNPITYFVPALSGICRKTVSQGKKEKKRKEGGRKEERKKERKKETQEHLIVNVMKFWT